ncbi:MAG: ammonium transporter, Amt family [Candidatus Atribacteria bacterium]|nr:ammonium transporter, Amt family [Candidatus Atribacteria bacterium]
MLVRMLNLVPKILILATLMVMFSPFFAFADESTAATNAVAIDTIWTLISAFLVFFMQAGFAMLETGFTRAKNAVNVLMKNLMDFSVGSIAFWMVGFGIMFGTDKLGLFGTSGFFLSSANPSTSEGLWQFAYWMFQVVFAATSVTIVSGALAERVKFHAYLVYSFVICALIYPVVGHWIWGGGWLGNRGIIDFAGSTIVHSVGGWAALAGAILIGPRLGKYNNDGTSNAIPGHNIPLATLGTFILWFGWFGFNPGSTLAGTNLSIATIAVTTNLAAAAGFITAMFTAWVRFGKPDTSMALNGVLAGLVSITAPCASVSPFSAIIIGAVAGILVVLSIEFIDKVLHIDDPVGAISVHGVCGTWGTLSVGLFAQAVYGEASGIGAINGLFFGGGLSQLLTQLIGVFSVFAWVFGSALVLFYIVKKTIGLRASDEEQLKGLDISEHGMESYAGFQIFTTE